MNGDELGINARYPPSSACHYVHSNVSAGFVKSNLKGVLSERTRESGIHIFRSPILVKDFLHAAVDMNIRLLGLIPRLLC